MNYPLTLGDSPGTGIFPSIGSGNDDICLKGINSSACSLAILKRYNTQV